MPKAIQKIKHIPTENSVLKETEKQDQPTQEILIETEKPTKAFLELPHNWWYSHSSIGASNKLKKVDLFQINKERICNLNLPLPDDWQVKDGDYEIELPENHVRIKTSREEQVSKERFLLAAAIAVVSIVVLLFSFIASMIKIN